MKKVLIVLSIFANFLMSQSISSIDPNTSLQGNSLWVTITGAETHFVVSDTTGVSNNVDSVLLAMDDNIIIATSFTTHSETELEAFFDIPEDATIGDYDVEVYQNMGYGLVTLADGFSVDGSVSISPGIIPSNHLLHQNYPNPFNPNTSISYDLPNSSRVTLTIYDLHGTEIRNLENGFMEMGKHNSTWDGKNSNGVTVSSGIYIYQLISASFISTKRMILMK